MSPARVQTLRLLDLEVSALTKRTPHKDFKLTHQGKVVQGSLKIHIPKQKEWQMRCEVPGKVIITMTKQSFTTNIVIFTTWLIIILITTSSAAGRRYTVCTMNSRWQKYKHSDLHVCCIHVHVPDCLSLCSYNWIKKLPHLHVHKQSCGLSFKVIKNKLNVMHLSMLSPRG